MKIIHKNKNKSILPKVSFGELYLDGIEFREKCPKCNQTLIVDGMEYPLGRNNELNEKQYICVAFYCKSCDLTVESEDVLIKIVTMTSIKRLKISENQR